MKKVMNGLIFSLNGDAFTALQKVLGSNINLTIKDINALRKTLISVSKQHEYVEERYKEIIKKYGEEDKEGNIRIIDKEKTKLANNDFLELLNLSEELDVRDFDTTKLEDENVKMTYVELLALEELFRKEETKDEKEVVEAEVVQ